MRNNYEIKVININHVTLSFATGIRYDAANASLPNSNGRAFLSFNLILFFNDKLRIGIVQKFNPRSVYDFIFYFLI